MRRAAALAAVAGSMATGGFVSRSRAASSRSTSSSGSDRREERENALFKVNTLIDALGRFRDALAQEADLAARSGG
jgi:hypothetical protein